MTYSLDFRQKVLEVQTREKLTLQEAAIRFDIGIATLSRWHRRLYSIQPARPRPNRKKINEQALLLDVQQHPDAYHYERARRFGVSAQTICRVLKKLGVSYKKNAHSSQSQRTRTYKVSRSD